MPQSAEPRLAAPPRPAALRLLLAVYAVCFLGAACNHARDLWLDGFLPYRHAPFAFNLFWTSLTALDPLTVALLYLRPRAGLVLALLVMTADVTVNSFALYAEPYCDWYAAASLQAQSLFLGFVIGTAPFAWRRVGGAGGAA
jgi:hypothetical protein